MNFVFLMDPLETVQMKKDTSFILMLEAHQRGHQVYFLPSGNIISDQGRLKFYVTAVQPQLDTKKPFSIKNTIVLADAEVDGIFIRTDPPFNDEYLLNTWLLDLLPKRVFIMNSPPGIRAVNEKIWANRFPELLPRTMIGRHLPSLNQFIDEEQKIIAKPSNSFGGQGIFSIKANDTNRQVILEILTHHGQEDIILQQYIPESDIGDKRIILLNGDPLGAVLRVHAPGDHRNNFFAGGQEKATTITENDNKIIQVLKPFLQRLGLTFVGIDIIGNYLIEVNVTSPTCLQEMNRLYNKHLESPVIDFVEQQIQQRLLNKS